MTSYTTPDRDEPIVILGAAWITHHRREVHTMPGPDLERAYRAARDLAAALGAERYRRADDGTRVQVIRHGIPSGALPEPADVLNLANVIGEACGAAYDHGSLPSSCAVADAILAAGYHRDNGE
jgi:hypothetical protein